MATLLRAIDRAVLAFATATTTALLALMSLITLWQVITRFVLQQPSTWSEVTARSLMIWMVYLGLAVVLRTGSLIAIDVLIGALPQAARKLLAVAIAATSLSVLAVMAWFGWTMAQRVAAQAIAGVFNPFTGNTISIAWVYAAIPAGAALSIVAVLARLMDDLHGHTAPTTPDHPEVNPAVV